MCVSSPLDRVVCGCQYSSASKSPRYGQQQAHPRAHPAPLLRQSPRRQRLQMQAARSSRRYEFNTPSHLLVSYFAPSISLCRSLSLALRLAFLLLLRYSIFLAFTPCALCCPPLRLCERRGRLGGHLLLQAESPAYDVATIRKAPPLGAEKKKTTEHDGINHVIIMRCIFIEGSAVAGCGVTWSKRSSSRT